jgi:chromosome transmission fidelity protein 1
LDAAENAQTQLALYLHRYIDRLSAQHLQLLGQLKVLLRGIITSMTPPKKSAGTSSSSTTTTTTTTTESTSSRVLLSSSQFLVSHKLETINVFPILRYMEETKLSQKLLGFMPSSGQSNNHNHNHNHNHNNHNNNNNNNNDVSDDTNTNNATSDVVSTSTSVSSRHISPMSIVETFLQKLTYANDDDGQIVIDYRQPKIEFVVLNPAVHSSDDLWTKPRAVCLVGGTLQPIDVMVQELIPSLTEHAMQTQSSWQQQQQQQQQQRPSPITHKSYKSDPFWAFTCGHVVDPSHVLLQTLTSVNGTSIDVRHKTRSTPEVCSAIGTAIVNLCQRVPHGVVVFLPSYKYEQILVDSWKTQQSEIWKRLHEITTVVREPKEASQVESTLSRYAEAATKSTKGALLLSVVGGKLSEGINFANDLCRCVAVVGLPYADRSDPLLQEKLKLVSNPQHYYRSLCLRAVNQSVGRAIRHANDYASIVMMDVRYKSDDAVARGLPSWLTDGAPNLRRQTTDMYSVLNRIDAFFEGMKVKNPNKKNSTMQR